VYLVLFHFLVFIAAGLSKTARALPRFGSGNGLNLAIVKTARCVSHRAAQNGYTDRDDMNKRLLENVQDGHAS